MLVVSRRESEKILFPTLGISVELLKIQGRKTKIGIDAPANIPVLRHECAAKSGIRHNGSTGNAVEFTSDLLESNQKLSELFHVIRQRLDSAASTLNELYQCVDADDTVNADSQGIMKDLFKELRLLETQANQVLEGSGISINDPTQALLVEDGACERKLLGGYLELCGFEVITAADGQDALDYLSMHSAPDVVLLDMMMPRLNGPTFVQQVRANPDLNRLSIFAISGKSQEEVEATYGATPVDRWFSKPVSPKELVSQIAQHLTKKGLIAA
jgi:CheY-like chemotaxis protein/sRNA-binding carbon storage regulator CsrA